MNDLNKMWPVCPYCQYWEVCDPPYNCAVTEKKYGKTKGQEDQDG